MLSSWIIIETCFLYCLFSKLNYIVWAIVFEELCPFYDSLFFKIEFDVLKVKLRMICDFDRNAAPIADNDNDPSGVT